MIGKLYEPPVIGKHVPIRTSGLRAPLPSTQQPLNSPSLVRPFAGTVVNQPGPVRLQSTLAPRVIGLRPHPAPHVQLGSRQLQVLGNAGRCMQPSAHSEPVSTPPLPVGRDELPDASRRSNSPPLPPPKPDNLSGIFASRAAAARRDAKTLPATPPPSPPLPASPREWISSAVPTAGASQPGPPAAGTNHPLSALHRELLAHKRIKALSGLTHTCNSVGEGKPSASGHERVARRVIGKAHLSDKGLDELRTTLSNLGGPIPATHEGSGVRSDAQVSVAKPDVRPVTAKLEPDSRYRRVFSPYGALRSKAGDNIIDELKKAMHIFRTSQV